MIAAAKTKCPHGGKFGKDTEHLDECEECELWDECDDVKNGDEVEELSPPKLVSGHNRTEREKHRADLAKQLRNREANRRLSRSSPAKPGHHEPALDELIAIQKRRNLWRDTDAKEDPLDPWMGALGEITRELKHRFRIQKYNALEIGGLYYTAKCIIRHERETTWGKWIDEVGLHKKTAVTDYIRIYRFCRDIPELVDAIPPTHLQIICRPSFPDDLREKIFERGCLDFTLERLKTLAERVRRGEISATELDEVLGELDAARTADQKKNSYRRILKHIEREKNELQRLAMIANDEEDEMIEALDKLIHTLSWATE